MEPKKPFGVLTVKERMEKLHKQNFRSLPFKSEPIEPMTVDEEIEQFRSRSMIRSEPVSNAPKLQKPSMDDIFMPPAEPKIVKEAQRADHPALNKVEFAVGKLDEIKKKMRGADNFLSLYYDLKKAEGNLKVALDEAKAANVELPTTINMRIQSIMKR